MRQLKTVTPAPSAPLLRVVVDTNVYFVPPVRDFLLNAGWLTSARLLTIGWSETILAEIERNWTRVTGPDRATERWHRFASRFREAFAAGYGEAAVSLRPDTRIASEDRHIVSLALALQADGIVTLNLRDFPQHELATLGLKVWHPDALCQELYARDPTAVLAILHYQGANLRPPRSLDTMLAVLFRTCPKFVEQVRTGSASR